jgi:ribosomal protein L12E/L44/L45/RPP1/RPP2
MIEENEQIGDEEPNPERVEAIQHACQIFVDVSRFSPQLAPRDENDLDEIVNGIVSRNGDLTDALAYTLEWRAIRERRQEAARQEVELAAKEEAHQQELADYKRPSSHDLPALQAEMRLRQPPTPKQFVSAHEYTDAEMSAMSSDEYRRLVLGGVSIDDRQGTTGHSYKPVIRPGNRNTAKPTLRNLKRRLEN